MPALKEISLLPSEEDLNSPSARALRWLTGVGRYIIVFTELIVILAFISRFWLDRQNSDLSEIIRQQKAILESTAEFEKEYDLLGQRLSQIKVFYQNQPRYDQDISSLAKSAPPQIIFNNFTITRQEDKQIAVTASLSSFSEEAIVDFITNLILNPAISKVDVKNIEKKPKSSTYTINLFLLFNNQTKS